MFFFVAQFVFIQGFSGVLQDETGGFSVKVTADESQLMILMEDQRPAKDPLKVGRLKPRKVTPLIGVK